jgi:ABC-type bacteriocin/lantibiotic exporter with double-glycine peptidase domain
MGSMAIGQLAPPLTAFVTAKAAAYPLLTVVRRRPLIDGLSEEGKKPFEKPKGHISFEEVRFAYPSRPDVEVCRGYNLDIKPGETMALVGASGCGKV